MADTEVKKSTRKKRRKINSQRKSIATAARTAFKEGLSNEETLAAIKTFFPESKTTIGSVRAMRAYFRTRGEKIPGARDAKKLRKEAPTKESAVITQATQSVEKPKRGRKPKTVGAQPLKPGRKPKITVVHAPAKVVAIASDHAGTALKETLKDALKEWGLVPLDLGTNSDASVDYPDYAQAVAQALAWGEATRGVVICGSGIGISIAANRHKHIRAALCTDGLMARLSRQHNDANVLALGARLTGIDVAKDCLYQFLHTQYEGGRHQRRIDKMS